MKILSKFSYLLILLLFQMSLAYAQDIIVLGAYQDKIVLYSKEGVKKALINSSEIIGKKILSVNEEGLGNIDYHKNENDGENWIRISAVKLSQSVTEPCQKESASQADDQNKPASSGWGCMKDEK